MFGLELLDKLLTKSAGLNSNYTLGHIERPRWNVVDILVYLSKPANPGYLFDECNAERSAEIAKCLSETTGQKITITAVLLKAIAVAQLSHPETASYRTPIGQLVRRPTPVAGFTIERVVEEGPAVFFGAIRDARTKSLLEIGREVSACANNDTSDVTQLWKQTMMTKVPWILRQFFILLSLNLPALRDLVNPSTFGLTSLGKFGLNNVLAPNVTTTIFGIGSMRDQAVVIDGQIKVQKMLSISMAADLRSVAFMQAGAFMHDVKKLIESGLDGHLHADDLELLQQKKTKKEGNLAETNLSKA